MTDTKLVLVVGLGEVGCPLLDVISQHQPAIGLDIAPRTDRIDHVDVMHVCYPFEMQDFIGTTVAYIHRFNPSLTVINSTVGIGTTRAIAERTGAAVVHSPVRGKHARMRDELLSYTKFIGALDQASAKRAADHFGSLGLKTRLLSSPEATELAKLTETTYFGLIIAWAQEVERYCDELGSEYAEVTSFYEDITFLPPVRYFPGVIGGHCVMPNIEVLSRLRDSPILNAIKHSNETKIERDARRGVASGLLQTGA
jgi:UDP-N-acetyl-D-mannosaminuronate dehydrogenase